MADSNLHVVLVEPEIHWNTGNAGRTCLAANAQLHLVEPLGFSLDAKEVKRAGLDYWERVNLRVWSDWAQFEEQMFDLGEPFFLSSDGERPFWEAKFPERTVLLFGKETLGFEEEIREKYHDRLLNIPIHENAVRSLNVSTCVGIAAYEFIRQRSIQDRRS